MIRIHPRPDLAADEAARAVRELYGLDGRLVPLPGERDLNFRLDAADGSRFVVKVSSPAEAHDILRFETEMIGLLRTTAGDFVPGIVPSRGGDTLVEYTDDAGDTHRLRVVEYLPGALLADARPRTEALLADLGRRVAELGRALGAYPDHPPARMGFDWALGLAGDVMERTLDAHPPARRALVEGALASFRAHESDFLGLGSQIIHADINDHNVLVSDPGDGPRRVTGIIDFGDAHSAPRVFDLAIAIAYAIFDTPDPLVAAAALTRGYHEEFPLLEAEIDVIVPLVRARLGQSVSISAWRRREHADVDPYLTVSESGAWRLLESFAQVPEALATGLLRDACGLDACPRSAGLVRWLEARSFEPVVALPDDPTRVTVLDLSVASPDVTGDDTDDTAAFTRRVEALMLDAGASVAVGRWLEPRGFYLGKAFEGRRGDPRERRTVHLGVDLFAAAGTEVHAPLAARVRSVTDHRGRLDYGPTVVLEHDGPEGPFWTLYGHLARASVEGLEQGTRLAAGAAFARLGAPPENGDWPPHLHFQIVTDLLGWEGDFPGVALPRERAAWASFSPDPNLVLGIDADTTYTEPAPVAGRRRAVLAPSLGLSYADPIHVVRGRGAYLYDALGRAYLDAVNNVAHVGHEHPRVVDAGRRQMSVLNTNTRYLHEHLVEYGERLVELFPAPLRVCLFVNSGSEANELALRMARAHTGGRGVVALEGGYHGHTQGLVDVSHYKLAGAGGYQAPPWVRFAALPDEYRGRYRRDDPERAVRYASHVAEAFAELEGAGVRPAAFLAESLLSCAGQIEPPAGYLAAAYAHARASGAVCVADEVQIGFGRVGTHTWGFESQGAVPDLVTLGKPIGNGHPIGAVVTTPEIAASFDNGMEFFSTFGGNPVSAAIGLAVLDVLRDEELQRHAAVVGGALKAGLAALGMRHPSLGDVRGRGLFLGVELVRDRDSEQPAPAAARYVVERMKARGVLLSTDGPDRNVLKLKPPLPFSDADGRRLVEELDRVLSEDFVRSVGA